MSVIKLDRWYMEGAPPVYHVKCPFCDREYRITDWQNFPCMCGKNQINFEEYVPPSALIEQPIKDNNGNSNEDPSSKD